MGRPEWQGRQHSKAEVRRLNDERKYHLGMQPDIGLRQLQQRTVKLRGLELAAGQRVRVEAHLERAHQLRDGIVWMTLGRNYCRRSAQSTGEK